METLLLVLQILASPAKGTMAHAIHDAQSCATPTAWIANDDRDGTDWYYAVCGTADGRICGQDVLWTDDACATPEDEPDHRHDCPAGPYSDPR